MNQAIKILEKYRSKIESEENRFRKEKNYEWADNNNAVKLLLQKIIDEISSLPSDTQGYTKKEVLDFAYWYHNGLLNRYRQEVEVEFDDFIKYHRQGLIPNKIIGKI